MSEVFIRNTGKKESSFNIGTILQRPPKTGIVGLEIEVEGKKLPHPGGVFPMKYWTRHIDGSLRGEENAEYVLAQPLSFAEVPKAIDLLWASFATLKSRLDDSNRTSIHVHLNCQEFYFNRLTAFVALYFTFEEILTQWCGEHRVGNLFCLRGKDAPATVTQLKRFIRADGQSRLSEGMHYAGLNIHALVKFGSLEIRTLRGVTDKETLLDWLGILERLYELSAEFSDPRDICTLFSSEGPMAFFDNVLGEHRKVVRSGVSMTEEQIRDSLYEGIRLAQDLCFCRDWNIFKPVKLSDDPFGRSKKTVVRKMQTLLNIEEHLGEINAQDQQWAPPPGGPALTTAGVLNQIHVIQQPVGMFGDIEHEEVPDFDVELEEMPDFDDD